MVKTRTFGRVFIFDVCGSTSDVVLTQNGDLETLLKEIEVCYKRNRRQIIVNLERVSHIDSNAVAALVAMQGSREGLQIRFYGMQPKVKHALQYTGFLTVFQVYESQRDAMQSFI